MRYVCSAVLALAASAVFLQAGVGVEPAASMETPPAMDAHPAMMAFARALLGVEKGLAAGDAEKVAAHAYDLREASGKIADLQPQVNEDLPGVFDAYRTRIGDQASDLVELAEARQLDEISRTLEEIRHTCISCHIKFRIDLDEYSQFPNVRNAIAGQVRVFKENGQERLDRSNVLVFLERVAGASPPPAKNPAIFQKDRRFAPQILPVVKGTTIDFPNDDRIFHNVFSLSKTQPFDLDIYPPGDSKSIKFERSGWVKIYCNIHPQMIAHVLVLDNSHYDLTDEQGLFVISGVPDGSYALRTWHEFGGAARRQIGGSGAALHRGDRAISEDRKLIQHDHKIGQPYRGKY